MRGTTDGDAYMDELLRIEHLCKEYNGNTVLDDVCMIISDGERIGIAGPSGEGKTTLALCIAGILRPDSGRIFLRGRDIATLKRKEMLGIQLIPQNPGSSLEEKMNVRSIMLEGIRNRNERDRILADILKKTGLSAEITGRKPSQLSGGEKARVAIARALSVSPSLLIADEPTASLDASLRASVLNTFAGLDAAMIIISHDEAVLSAICGRIYRLKDGKLICSEEAKPNPCQGRAASPDVSSV